jgi:hypothetical protein
VAWIGLSQERDKFRVLVYAVMNIRVLYNTETLSSGYTHLAGSGVVLSFTVLVTYIF